MTTIPRKLPHILIVHDPRLAERAALSESTKLALLTRHQLFRLVWADPWDDLRPLVGDIIFTPGPRKPLIQKAWELRDTGVRVRVTTWNAVLGPKARKDLARVRREANTLVRETQKPETDNDQSQDEVAQ